MSKKAAQFPTNADQNSLEKSVLLPVLDYADVCYLDVKKEQLNLSGFKIFALGLCWVRKHDHISEFQNKLKWLPVRVGGILKILKT